MAENTSTKVQPCFVELEGSVTQEVKAEAERKCNAAIRQALDVQVKMCQIGDPELDAAHTRGLPEDVSGPVRIISIGDIDSNLCCGTHVSNLAQLQVVKLLGWEKSKREGRTNLYFLVGDRAISYLEKCYKREEVLGYQLANRDFHSYLPVIWLFAEFNGCAQRWMRRSRQLGREACCQR